MCGSWVSLGNMLLPVDGSLLGDKEMQTAQLSLVNVGESLNCRLKNWGIVAKIDQFWITWEKQQSKAGPRQSPNANIQ